MEVLVNERLVKQRAKIGKYASLGGLAILAGGLVASFTPQFLYVSFAALIIGFMLSQVGSYHTLRWLRRPRSDEVLAKALKGQDRKFKMYHYFLPASHVLIGPTGLFVFLVKAHSGQVRCEGNRWRQKMTLGRVFLLFGQESLGNPATELQHEIDQLTKFISQNLPGLQVSIRGAVVFSNPKVELILEEPSVTVLQPKQLKPFVRRPLDDHGYFSGEDRRRLGELFDSVVVSAETG